MPFFVPNHVCSRHLCCKCVRLACLNLLEVIVKSIKLVELLIVFFVALVARCLPHLANFSPLLGLLLLVPVTLSRQWGWVSCLLALIVTDGLLAVLTHQSWFGSWTVWTYSGFLGVWMCGRLKPVWLTQWLPGFITAMSASTLFWGWTNLGVWLSSGLYAQSWAGLANCFAAALPFLSRSVLSTLVVIVAYLGYQPLVQFMKSNKHLFLSR